MDKRCTICGSRKTLDSKSPSICQFMCYWVLEGWLGWNARKQEVAIRDHRALMLFPDTLSYPKTIEAARMMGWHGRENAVGTF